MFNLLNKKWDFRFLAMCKLVATFSKDPSTKCGAVLVNPNRSIVSIGFNGLPSTIPAANEEKYLLDRELKLATILHAEENSIAYATQSLENCCVYTYPIMTCAKCASQLLQRGVRRFVAPKLSESDSRYERWEPSFKISRELIKSSHAELIEYEYFD